MFFFSELRRRKVFQVAVAYAVVGWVLAQIADLAFPALLFPDWFLRAFIVVLLLGFPVALILAWAYEVTPEGVRRTEDANEGETPRSTTSGQTLNYIVIGVLVVAVAYLAWTRELEAPAAEGDSISVDETPIDDTIKAIAVLPFVNLSDDPQHEILAEGIAGELLNVLAKVQDLRVPSRTSAFSFKGTNTPLPEIAAALDVQYILEGSLQRGSNEVRITPQLIDVATDRVLWNESFTRRIEDIFAVQDEIVSRVSDALEVALLGADAAPLAPARETAPDVYGDYLEARQLLGDPTFEKLARAVDLFESVIERDPSYAPAYGALAYAYWRRTVQGSMTTREAYEHLRILAPRALELDDSLAEAWNAQATVEWIDGHSVMERLARTRARELGFENEFVLAELIYYFTYARDAEPATSIVDQLLRIDPLGPESLRRASQFYARIGERDRGREILERLHEMDPQSARYHWEMHNGGHLNGDLTALAGVVEEVMRIDPLDPEGPGFLAHLYLELGEMESAARLSRAALEVGPDHPFSLMVALYVAFMRGDSANVDQIGERLLDDGVPGRMGSRVLALAALAERDSSAGRVDEAVRRYLRAYPSLAENRVPIRVPEDTWAHVASALYAALDLARLYRVIGATARVDALLDAVEAELPNWTSTGNFGIDFAAAELHAMRAETDDALTALRAAADADAWIFWRWRLLENPNLDSLRDDPEFQAVVDGMEARMAGELERIRSR